MSRRQDNQMTTAMYRHANGKAIKGRRHGNGMAAAWRRHCDDMATTLRRHGDDVMTTWRRCGDDDDANGGEATAITTTRGNLPAPSCSITVSPPSWQSVMLSLGVCACVFVNVFLCMVTSIYNIYYIYIYVVCFCGSWSIDYFVLGFWLTCFALYNWVLHTLHMLLHPWHADNDSFY